MQTLSYGVTGFFWLLCYGVAIWICVIGKRRNPNNGWNFLIAAEIIYIIVLFPSLYYIFLAVKLPVIFLLKSSEYVHYLSLGLILPLGMIIFLVGLYYIAAGKKRSRLKRKAGIVEGIARKGKLGRKIEVRPRLRTR